MHARIFFLTIVSTSAVVAAFTDKKVTSLTLENEALKKSLEIHRHVAGPATADVPSDPLDLQTGYSRVTLEDPMAFHADLNKKAGMEEFLKKSEKKVGALEAQIKLYRHEALGYQMMIDALKNEINIKDEELQQLRTSIAELETENQKFLQAIEQNENDLKAAIANVGNRQYASELEGKVQHLSRNLRMAEADACYARAQLTEIAAHRVLFSPGRKKEYLREALEAYKKALSLGKEEALEDISKLQKSLFPSIAKLN